MTLCNVPDCARPAHDGWRICGHCSWTLERALGDIPALAAELETTLTRQTAAGARNGSRSATRPLPYDAKASEATWVLRSVLVGWVRDLLEHHDEDWPADTIPALSVWLLGRMWRLQAHEAANEIVTEIGAAVGECWRAVDRPAARVYAGTCLVDACPSELYAKVGKDTVRCHACGITHDVAERQHVMRRELHEKLLTVREIARMAAWLGVFDDTAKTEARLNLWVHRGALLAAGVDLKGRATYPFGDVYLRLEAAFKKAG